MDHHRQAIYSLNRVSAKTGLGHKKGLTKDAEICNKETNDSRYILSDSDNMKNDLILNTVVKTFQVLEFLTESDSSYTLTKLAKKLKISIGTAQRITNTLNHLGYLSRDPETKSFRLTSKWIQIGLSVLHDMDLRQVAYPYLRKLNEETNETVSLGVIENFEVVVIERIATSHLITTNIRPGVRRPIHSNSIGKVILAFQDEIQIKSILDKIKLTKYTDTTLVKKDNFRRELERIKEKGYSINDGESDKNVFAIGVPILNNFNVAISGINLVIPKARLNKSVVYEKYVPAIIQTGMQISKEFGNFQFKNK